jgi:hypothetical protein
VLQLRVDKQQTIKNLTTERLLVKNKKKVKSTIDLRKGKKIHH